MSQHSDARIAPMGRRTLRKRVGTGESVTAARQNGKVEQMGQTLSGVSPPPSLCLECREV